MSCLCCGSIASPVKKKDRPIEIVDTSYKKGAEQAEQDTNLQVKTNDTIEPEESTLISTEKDAVASKEAGIEVDPIDEDALLTGSPRVSQQSSCFQEIPPEIQKLLDMLEVKITRLLELQHAEDFEPNGNKDNVELSLLSEDKLPGERQIVRGKLSFGKIGTHKHEEILGLLLDLNRRGEWDTHFSSGRVLENLTEIYHLKGMHLRKCHMVIKAMMGVAQRDFVYVAISKRLDEKRTVSLIKSIEDARWPEGHFNTRYVRGKLHFGASLISDEPDGYTYVSQYVQADPGGSVPQWIVNKVQYKQPAVISGLLRLLETTC